MNSKFNQIGRFKQYRVVYLKRFQDFHVIQILREIIFGEFKSSKIAVYSILGALNFVNLAIFSLQKVQEFIKSKFRASKCVKMADFALLVSPKLVNDRNS